MKRTTFQAVVNVTTKHFKKGGEQADADKNGNMPLQFTVLAGQLPSRSTVISGTIGQTLGFEAGKTYVIQSTFRDTNEFGDNYNVQNLGPLAALDLVKLPDFVKAFGQPKVLDVVEDTVIANADVLSSEN